MLEYEFEEVACDEGGGGWSLLGGFGMETVTDQGRIVEDGPHAELVAKGGDYARLWNRQTGAFAGE